MNFPDSVPPWLLPALARLDARLDVVCAAEEARTRRAMGPGGTGWQGVRAMLTTRAAALLFDEEAAAPLVEGGDHPLGFLGGALALDPVAVDLLLLLLAPHVEVRYRTVLGVLQDTAAAAYLTDRALQAVLGRSPAGWSALHAALAPGSALVGGGFLRNPSAEAPLARSWDLAADLGAILLGAPADRALGDVVARWIPLPGSPDGGRALHAIPGDVDWEAHLLARHEHDAAGLLVAMVPRAGSSLALRAAWRAALASGAVLVADVDGLGTDEAEEASTLARSLTTRFGGRVVLVSRHPLPLPTLPVRPPGYRARVEAWSAAVAAQGGMLTQGAAERLAASRRVSRTIIATIVAQSPALDEHTLATTAERVLQQEVPHGLHRPVRHSLDDLVLRDTTRAGLERLLYFARNRDRIGEDPDRERAWRLDHGPVVLFSGRSGTGKTLAAEAVAGALHRPLVVVDLSRLVSKYIGETEKNIDGVLSAAQRAGCVLFFDEADALFAQRTEVSSSNDRYANLEVGYLLQRIEQHDGVVILATNLRQSVDEAFLRRFQFRIEFPLPDEQERERLWGGLLAVAGADPAHIDLGRIASTHRLSGGDIRNASLKALLLSEAEGRPLSAAHIDASVALELLEMGRLSRRPDTAVDRGQILARVVDAMDAALRAHFTRLFLKEIHVIHGAPTREVLAGRRPAVALSLFRVAGPRGGRGFRFAAILSAWSNRPEEEHELLGVIHDALVAVPSVTVPGGQAALKVQESSDFDLLHRFWSSHGHPVRASVVVEGEAG